MNEAETRAEMIDPKLKDSGWGIVEGSKVLRKSGDTRRDPNSLRFSRAAPEVVRSMFDPRSVMGKRLFLFLIIPAAGFLLTGCAVNLKNDPLYKVYMRKELALVRSARIIERKYASQTIWSPGGELKTGELYQLVDLGDEEFENRRKLYESYGLETRNIYGQEYELAEGTPLKLKKIYSFMDGSGGVDVRAQGLIYFKERGAYVPFEFLWSKQGPGGGHQFLPRKLKIAPWEKDVPDDRAVKYNGQSR